MFKTRLLTALVLIPAVLLLIFLANQWVFAGLLTVLMLGCGWEFLALIPLVNRGYQALFLLSLMFVLIFAYYLAPIILWISFGIWLLILPSVIYFPASQRIWGHIAVVAGAGSLLLPAFAVSLFYLFQQEQGCELILYLLLLIWAADSGAYGAGKLWGKHKWIPRVSPGKTIEGALGGMGLAMCVAFLGYLYFNPYTGVRWFLIACLTVCISMLGDLYVSMLKRRVALKDTGTIFPGHGGLLDRVDSLMAAAPLFYLGLYSFPPGL